VIQRVPARRTARRLRRTVGAVPLWSAVAASLVASAVLALPAGAMPAGATSPGGMDGAVAVPAGQPPLAAQLRLRGQLQLTDTPAQVSLALAQGTVDPRFGIALTAAEHADIARRDAATALGSSLQTRLRALLPGSFGGLSLHLGPAGNVVEVLLTDSAAATTVASAAKELGIPAGTTITERTTSVSEARLQKVNAALQADLTSLDAAGYKLWATSLDEDAGRIDILVEPGSPPGTEAALAARYGALVHVERKVPDSRGDDRSSAYPHVRAGQKIVAFGTSHFCSVGHEVRSTHNGHYYAIIAGHCGLGPGTWTVGGVSMGTEGTNLRRTNVFTNCDCLAIGPLPTGKATNVVYTGPNTGVNITREELPSTASRGAMICMSGAGSNSVQCGHLGVSSYSCKYPDGTWLQNQGAAGYVTSPGDSGAPVYAANTAYGYNSGHCGGNSVFSWLTYAESGMSVRLLTSTPS
jgi:hypothetical protein